jgi:hypothetical protein
MRSILSISLNKRLLKLHKLYKLHKLSGKEGSSHFIKAKYSQRKPHRTHNVLV